ncbi:MAG: sugar phosphate isomerase/epimerase family protein [bacterium]
MRLAIQEGIFPVKDFPEFLRKAKGWGLKEVEVWGEGLGNRIDVVKKALKETGLSACSICPGDRGIRGSLIDGDWKAADSDLRDFLRLGAALGGTAAGTAAGTADGAAVILVPRFRRKCFLKLYPTWDCFEGNREKFLERLAPIAKEAEELGVTILLEPLNRYEADFLITIGQAAKLCGELGSPRVKILADLFHMNIEEDDIPAVLAEHAKWIGHVHLADSNRKLPGMGHIDFPAALRALEDSGYGGPLCIECHCPGPDTGTAAGPDEEIRRSIERLRAGA